MSFAFSTTFSHKSIFSFSFILPAFFPFSIVHSYPSYINILPLLSVHDIQFKNPPLIIVATRVCDGKWWIYGFTAWFCKIKGLLEKGFYAKETLRKLEWDWSWDIGGKDDNPKLKEIWNRQFSKKLCKIGSLQRDFSVHSVLINFAATNFRLGFSSEEFAISKVWRGIWSWVKWCFPNLSENEVIWGFING